MGIFVICIYLPPRFDEIRQMLLQDTDTDTDRTLSLAEYEPYVMANLFEPPSIR